MLAGISFRPERSRIPLVAHSMESFAALIPWLLLNGLNAVAKYFQLANFGRRSIFLTLVPVPGTGG